MKITGLPFLLLLLFTGASFAQSIKPKSYIISKEEKYTIDVRNNKPHIEVLSQQRKWVGDKEDVLVQSNRINYTDSFEVISDIQAYSVSPENKKEKVKNIFTQDVEIAHIFYHDMKFKYYYFDNLKEGSETFSSYKKQFKVPQFLDTYYFKDFLDCKNSKISISVSSDVEIGYTLHGNDTDKITFNVTPQGATTLYTWSMPETEKEERYTDAPGSSYFSPHLIFYIKSYNAADGKQSVLGTIEDLYAFYRNTIKDINKTDQTDLEAQTSALIKDLSTDYQKTEAIFNYVQSKVNYVAFEDGMGGFIPREAADVLQKKYGDCKDMANLLNEMLTFAGIESHIAWIGTRHNNYTYEKVPTPIVDNHMIAVAKINNEYIFLDATGQYTLFPGFTPFIQGKEALLKVSDTEHKIVSVPVIPAEKNGTVGKISMAFDAGKISGKARFDLTGFIKSQFLGYYKGSIKKNEMLKEYFSRFIQNLGTSNLEVKNEDLTQTALAINCDFELEKWVKEVDSQLLFKPILFFPYSNSRIDTDKRKVPVEFDFKQSYDFEYEMEIPAGYKVTYKPDVFHFKTDLITADIDYNVKGNKVVVSQKMSVNVLLLEKSSFEAWNNSIKTITKQYNQNIILTKI